MSEGKSKQAENGFSRGVGGRLGEYDGQWVGINFVVFVTPSSTTLVRASTGLASTVGRSDQGHSDGRKEGSDWNSRMARASILPSKRRHEHLGILLSVWWL